MSDEELMRLWQGTNTSPAESERLARELLTRVWRFDRMISRRNAREYIVGVGMIVFFAGMLLTGRDRVGAVLGLLSVSFVLLRLWWKHRHLQPLDPAADVTEYKAALLARIDAQIRLLRGVPYWYLLPLSVWPVWVFAHTWSGRPWAAVMGLLLLFVSCGGIGWLNAVWAVRRLRARRASVESMFPQE